MSGRVIGEGGDAVGAAAIEGGFYLGQRGVDSLTPGNRVCDVVSAVLLVVGQDGQLLPMLAFGVDCLRQPAFGGGDLILDVGDRLVVVVAPPPSPGIFESSPALGQ